MINLLSEILCAIEGLATLIVNGVVAIVNQLITGIAIMAEAALSLLPNMPSAPAAPDSGVLSFLNWFVPLAPLAALVTTMAVMFAAYMAVRIALNWIRAL